MCDMYICTDIKKKGKTKMLGYTTIGAEYGSYW